MSRERRFSPRPHRLAKRTAAIAKPSTKLDRVLEALRRDIDSGRMQPGRRYPVRALLEKRFKVSWYTIHKAFEQLKRDGVVVSRKRGGTFVAEHPPHLCDYGLVFPRHVETVYRKAITRAARQLGRQGRVRRFHDYLIDEDPTRKAVGRLVEDVRCRRLAGVVFFLGSEEAAAGILDDLSTIPMVTAPRRSRVTGLPSVLPNVRKLIRTALDEIASRGRRRVAFVGCRRHAGLSEVFAAEAASRNLETRPLWFQLGLPEAPDSVGRLVQLMLFGPADETPDALLVADGALFDGTAAGVAARGGQAPLVVTHCRTDQPIRAPWETVRIAFDETDLLRICTRAIDRARQGKRLARTLRVGPRVIE